MKPATIGILGGGQLGRMLVEAASRIGVKTITLDSAGAPAAQIKPAEDHLIGSFKDEENITELSKKVDILTIEIEHVDTTVFSLLDISVCPAPETIKLIQDKYLQKEHLAKNNVAVCESFAIENSENAIKNAGTKIGYPFLLKSRTNAYDGRGNYVVKTANDITAARSALGEKAHLYVEKFVPFVCELAVMVVKTKSGAVHAYPVVETVHKDNICHVVYAPARVSSKAIIEATKLSIESVKSLPGTTPGIFGVELFLLSDDSLLVNEIAPRPHNSGHYTLNACVISQFEALIRAVADIPLPKDFNTMTTPLTNAVMVNILGDEKKDGEIEMINRAYETTGASVYLYGKESKPKRKIGHINIVGDSMKDCERKANYILNGTNEVTLPSPVVSIIMGSDSDLPVMSDACAILEKFNVPFECTIVSAHRTPQKMAKFAADAPKRGLQVIIAGAGGAAHLPGMVAAMTPLPVIGVPVKGSRLDGVDSLYSIVQMPRGVPVATVAINNATNAALLAIRILGSHLPQYFNALSDYALDMEKIVEEKALRLEQVGYKKY